MTVRSIEGERKVADCDKLSERKFFIWMYVMETKQVLLDIAVSSSAIGYGDVFSSDSASLAYHAQNGKRRNGRRRREKKRKRECRRRK